MRVPGLLLVLCLALSAFAAEWPQFLGPNRNGISPEKGINQAWGKKAPKVLWKVAMSDNGYSGPAVAGGKVFIVDHQGNQDVVRALDLGTGKESWRFSYADATNDNYGFARSTPTVAGGKVYVISRNGQVLCLDAAKGKKLWARNIQADFKGEKPQWDYSMSALVDGNNVIVTPGGPNAAVAALNKDTGKTVWQGGGSDIPGYATPVVATIGGVKQYVVFTGVALIGVNAKDGGLLWRFPWKTGCDVNAAVPIVVGNNIFITSGYGHGCALVAINGKTATKVWQNKAIQAHFSTPVVSGGYIYGDSDPGKLVCLELKTGKVCWQKDGFEKGALLAVDGVLIAMNGNGGEVIMVKMASNAYKELGRITPLGGQSWTAPVLSDGKLLVRNQKAMVCLAVK